MQHRGFLRRKRDHAGERRTNTGRPTRGERHARQERGWVAQRTIAHFDPRFMIQERDTDDADEVDAENNQNHAGDVRQISLGQDDREDGQRAPDRDKDQRKAKDKYRRVGDRLAPRR